MIASRGLFRLRAAERIRAGVATATIGAMIASPVCGWAGNNTPENAGARQAPARAVADNSPAARYSAGIRSKTAPTKAAQAVSLTEHGEEAAPSLCGVQ